MVRCLPERGIDPKAGYWMDQISRIADIVYDPNHELPIRMCGIGAANPVADGILSWPEAFGHCVVDDDDSRRIRSVARAEISPVNEVHSRRGKIARSDVVEIGHLLIDAQGWIATLDAKVASSGD